VPSFLGGKSCCAFGQPALFLAGNRMTIVVFEKEVSLKVEAYLAKRFFDSAEVLNWRKILNLYEWKQKVKKNTQLSFWWMAKSSSFKICLRGLHLCCVLLRSRNTL